MSLQGPTMNFDDLFFFTDYFVTVVGDSVLLYSPDWPRTHNVA